MDTHTVPQLHREKGTLYADLFCADRITRRLPQDKYIARSYRKFVFLRSGNWKRSGIAKMFKTKETLSAVSSFEDTATAFSRESAFQVSLLVRKKRDVHEYSGNRLEIFNTIFSSLFNISGAKSNLAWTRADRLIKINDRFGNVRTPKKQRPASNAAGTEDLTVRLYFCFSC